MGSPGEPIFNQRHAPIAPLGDHGEVAAVPTQRRRAVGLMAIEVPRGQRLATAQVAQLHRGTAPLLHDHGQHVAVATDGGFLLLTVGESARGTSCF
jgi:hypothetical protein